MTETTDISNRLRASVAMDAVNGDSFERNICGKQMLEAANEIDRLRACSDELAEVTALAGELRKCRAETLREAALVAEDRWDGSTESIMYDVASELNRMAEEAEGGKK